MSEKRFDVWVNECEVSIVDTEEDNGLLFNATCETVFDAKFLKQECEQLADALNYLYEECKKLNEENVLLKKYLAIFKYDYRMKQMKEPPMEV